MLVCAVALAACGGAGTSGASASGGGKSAIAFSQCMRAHGVPDFPDPSPGGGISLGDGISLSGSGSGLNPQSPAFQAAQQTCMKRLNGGHVPPPISAAQKAKLIAMSQCMRTHGVPDFPDPTFSTGGGGARIEIGGPGIDPRSPAFQKAATECGGPGRHHGPAVAIAAPAS